MVYRSQPTDSSISPDEKREPEGAFVQHVEALIFRKAAALFGQESPLLETMRYHFKGGKRLRALLPALMAQHYGVVPQRLAPFAAACEVLHHATLAHDDLEDGDELRRGQLAIWRRFGEARAINLGDGLIILSYGLLDDLPVAAEQKLAVMRRMSQACARSIDGQEREFVSRQLPPEDVTVDRVLAIAQGKTSALFALPLVASAELCGASAHELQALAQSVPHLGACFQIQDDILDFLGHKKGRPAQSDLLEGKRSILVALACESLPRPQSQALLDFLDRPDEEKTPQLLSHYADVLSASLDDAHERWKQQRELFLGQMGQALLSLATRLLSLLTHPSICSDKAGHPSRETGKTRPSQLASHPTEAPNSARPGHQP